MLFPASTLDELLRRLRPLDSGFVQSSVAVEVAPVQLVRAGAPFFGSAQLMSSPGGDSVAGLGVAWSASASGRQRLRSLASRAAGLTTGDPEQALFLGFSFSPAGPIGDEWKGYAAADLVLPQVSVVERGTERTLTLVCPPGTDPGFIVDALRMLSDRGGALMVDPGDHFVESLPPTAEWRAEVADAVESIRGGAMRKVVLTRSVVVRAEAPADGFDVAAQLMDRYPQCYTFGWRVGESTFVGASPELLLEKRGQRVLVNPLAGSAPRGEGEDEDYAIGEALMASSKDREEHALVVDDVLDRLEPFTDELHAPSSPSLRKVATVQHLSTEVTGNLLGDATPFSLLEALHPTPAVGGTPRLASARFIEDVEAIDRGWYTGGIGWVTPGGDCRIAQSLRCGLLRGNTAHLFAGAGVVAESDPDAELAETRLKFRPLLELLAAT